MRVMAQIAMVMNLDKCIGCHTCSVTCKQTWTNRTGTEYMWFNNVETRPGVGYPHTWEDQDTWHGGWRRTKGGRLVPRSLGDLGVPPSEMDRHIAWDIGMAGTSRVLADLLDACLIEQVYSRLVIDCNRDPSVPSAMPEISESTPIPDTFWRFDTAIAVHPSS